jgi:hypothetical protein
MSDRWERRKSKRETEKFVLKAKQDMSIWITELQDTPSELEIRAWQAGYVAGINMASNRKEAE